MGLRTLRHRGNPLESAAEGRQGADGAEPRAAGERSADEGREAEEDLQEDVRDCGTEAGIVVAGGATASTANAHI
jgi:hypothetical protein